MGERIKTTSSPRPASFVRDSSDDALSTKYKRHAVSRLRRNEARHASEWRQPFQLTTTTATVSLADLSAIFTQPPTPAIFVRMPQPAVAPSRRPSPWARPTLLPKDTSYQ
jgi:hypothetical protein